ncbi:MAG: helix-turn-helix domain-containing protein [Pseudomonadales bacterium]|nr:helix-turn-helix domain-containing protein [Pseudomonadales bacterium]
MDDILYTVDEAAALLKLHPKTLRIKLREGALQYTRVGKQYRITRQQLQDYCGGTLPTPQSVTTTRQAIASCVVDVDAISPEESTRITNMLMASLRNPGEQSAGINTRVDNVYYPEIGKLKVLISGDIEACRGLMALLDALLKNR